MVSTTCDVNAKTIDYIGVSYYNRAIFGIMLKDLLVINATQRMNSSRAAT